MSFCRPLLISTFIALALSAGCHGDAERCVDIKAKLASCHHHAGQPNSHMPADGRCSEMLLDRYDELMAMDCASLIGAGKSDLVWATGGCDAGYHRCGGYFCCAGDGPVDKLKAVIERHVATARYRKAPPSCDAGSWLTGMDCSCFVQQTFKEALGVDIPRNSLHQRDRARWTVTTKPGDLVFFYTFDKWNPLAAGKRNLEQLWNWIVDAPTHVGIHLGYDERDREVFAHMSSSHGRIMIVDLLDYIAALEARDGGYKGSRRVIDYWDGIGYD